MGNAPSEVLLSKEASTVDQITTVFDQIDAIKDDKDAVYAQISEVENMKSYDDFKLGGLLNVAMKQKWYKNDGYKNYPDFLKDKFPTIEYRKAKYLIDMYVSLTDAGIEWEAVKDIGWTKLSRLAPVLTAENAADWFDKARDNTTPDLLEFIKAAKKSQKDEVPSDDDVDKPVKKNFSLHADQVEVVEDALEKAKEEAETDFDGVALDAICQNYLSGASVAAPPTGDQAPGEVQSLRAMIQAAGYQETIDLIESIWPNLKISAEMEIVLDEEFED